MAAKPEFESVYFFFLKWIFYSHAAIYRVNTDASIGTKVGTYRWFPKFNHVRFYHMQDMTYVLLFNSASRDVYIYDMKPWGKNRQHYHE